MQPEGLIRDCVFEESLSIINWQDRHEPLSIQEKPIRSIEMDELVGKAGSLEVIARFIPEKYRFSDIISWNHF